MLLTLKIFCNLPQPKQGSRSSLRLVSGSPSLLLLTAFLISQLRICSGDGSIGEWSPQLFSRVQSDSLLQPSTTLACISTQPSWGSCFASLSSSAASWRSSLTPSSNSLLLCWPLSALSSCSSGRSLSSVIFIIRPMPLARL
jgi:hypothetical protein